MEINANGRQHHSDAKRNLIKKNRNCLHTIKFTQIIVIKTDKYFQAKMNTAFFREIKEKLKNTIKTLKFNLAQLDALVIMNKHTH